jgi:hypothetical protein
MKIELTHDQWLQVFAAMGDRISVLTPTANRLGPGSFSWQAVEECKSIKAHIERKLTGEDIAS